MGLLSRRDPRMIYCTNGCEATFHVSRISLKVEQIEEKGIDVYYFSCPLCQKRYNSYYIQGGKVKTDFEAVGIFDRHL